MIAAGGTGGHLYPGIALAEEFRRSRQARVSFITTPKQVTLDILRQYDFPWQILSAQALKGTGMGRRLLSLLRLPFSYWQARRLLRREKPQLVVGMGGYISGPVGLAASRLGIPLVIHEQNAILGTTNKLLGRFASTIFLSFPQSEDNPAPEKSIWAGNPIRAEFCSPPAHLRAASPFTILVMGGSQGAHHLNMQILAALPLLSGFKANLHFIHLTGPADRTEVQAGYRQAGVKRHRAGLQSRRRNFHASGPPGHLPVRSFHPGGINCPRPRRHPGPLPLRRQSASGKKCRLSQPGRGCFFNFKSRVDGRENCCHDR